MPDETVSVKRPQLNTRFTRVADTDIPRADERDDTPTSRVRKPPRRLLDANDEEITEAQTSPDIIDTLTAEERANVEENAPAVRTALVKAMMARAEPGRYTMADDDDDMEPLAMRAVSVLDDSLVERLMPRVTTLLRDESRARRMLGANATRNFREPLRIKKIRPRITIRRPEQQERSAPPPPQSQSVIYTRALVELRAVHCLRITEPRDNPDEMVLGTVLVGAGGNVNAGAGVDLGEFRNGELFSYGELPLGQFSLKSTNGYPKHMYVLFKLVETDAEGRETARDLTKAIGALAKGIVSIYAGAAVGETAEMVVNVVGGFFQGIIDEDEFPIVGKRLTLDHMHDLGGSVGPRERTGDIGGHGGKYRIGYRWLMGA